jgi:tetratricopeptide (TPR) repeat protein
MQSSGDSVVAEGGSIDDLVGDEAGRSESESKPGAADALALAVAIEQARYDPELSRRVGAYVEEQRRLVQLQVKHFEEEHYLAIDAAKRKRLADRLRIGLQIFVALIAGGALVGVAAMIWDALSDHGIRIEALSVPADLAEKGLTGQILADQILSRIAELDRGSYTIRAANTYANNWGKDVKVEIPETGVSIGEISHLIHEHLGHATRVDGEVYHSPDGLTVSVRVGDGPTVEASGADQNLRAMVQEVATRVYAQTQPYRYAFWLGANGRIDEANALYRRLVDEGPKQERVWALHGLAFNSDSVAQTISYDQQALDIDPDFLLAAEEIAAMEGYVGHTEAALSRFNAVITASARVTDTMVSQRGRAALKPSAEIGRDEALSDYQSELANATISEDVANSTATRSSTRLLKAKALIRLHDPGAAEAILALLSPEQFGSHALVGRTEVRALVDAERGDWTAVATGIERLKASNPTQIAKDMIPARLDPLLAEAYARLGRVAAAEAVLTGIGADVYDGWRARGRVATLHQDFDNGQKALAEALRQGPSIPRAYNDWGELLATKGDLAGAMARFAEANQRGPHWADPLKAWGDVLAKQGHAREALAKYDQAIKYAPNWAALKLARDTAAAAR